MPDPARILLVSPDLMVASRIGGLTAALGVALDTIRSLDAPLPGSGYRVVILDLQGLAGDAGTAVSRARDLFAGHGSDTEPRPALVAFGPHVAADLLQAARGAGADEVVSRGELLGAFAAVIGRHLA